MMDHKSTSVELVIKNAKIFFNQQIIEGGVAVDKGKIVRISKDSQLPSGEEILDLKRQLIIPGVIDIHAHLRDLNFSGKEDFYTGTCAAASGGITTVIDMPNTNPPTISAQLMEQKIALARKKIIINTGFYAGIPNTLDELPSLVMNGVFGFKLYLTNSLSLFDIENAALLQKLLRKLKEISYPLLIHAERKQDIEKILLQKKEEQLTPEALYLESHSAEIEKHAIEYMIGLNRSINTQYHFCHVSTASGVEQIRQAKDQGSNISAEVTPHHLFLTENDLKVYGSFAKMIPPLRAPSHVTALWAGLREGTLDIIATDHAPHMLSEKNCEFSTATNGIPGFETLLPLLFTAISNKQLSLSRAIQALSENPAKFLHLSHKGKIAVGFDADLTVIDLKKRKKIDATQFYSKAKYSPFDGHEVIGSPTMTIIDGKIIMREGKIIAPPGSGTIIQRQF